MNQIKDELKAIGILLSVGIVWAALIYINWEAQLILTIIGFLSADVRLVSKSYWMIQDCLVNVLHGGFHKATVSSKFGHLAGKSKSMFYVVFVVDYVWEKFTGIANHCRSAIEPEDKHRSSPLLVSIGLSVFYLSLILHLAPIN